MAIVGVDFDGTVVTHEYPNIGRDIGAIPVLKKLVDKGHKIILVTMRDGGYLEEAINWFFEQGIPLYGANKNPDQDTWTKSPKVYCNLYIDDVSLGVPLTFSPISNRPFVDWQRVEKLLKGTYL